MSGGAASGGVSRASEGVSRASGGAASSGVSRAAGGASRGVSRASGGVSRVGRRSSAERVAAAAEDQYLARFERALAALSQTVDRAVAASAVDAGWIGRARVGLVAFLGFFEDRPRAARVLALAPGDLSAGAALRCEQRLLGVLTSLLDDGAPTALGEAMLEPELISELVAGGVVAVVAERIRKRPPLYGSGSEETTIGEPPGETIGEPPGETPGDAPGETRGDAAGERAEDSLVGLAPALMAFVVLPYLGLARAREELAGFGTAARPGTSSRRPGMGPGMGSMGPLPIRVTHRTTVVLKAIADAPCASNRDVARIAEISDEGQASKLLARLAHRGLIENLSRGVETGEPNAWRLTGEGVRALELIGRAPLHPPRRRVKGAAGVGVLGNGAGDRSGGAPGQGEEEGAAHAR